ncbi:hydrogenase formation protein HypD [Deferrisoma camini]|uniref:hydrogenase formation protein HypD n=1 Tax=Deferrisoma camini TaxID=1035120 RepID=UPI0004A2F7B1|nr:hydrogenase formation protein HypD [Deferrisoma camini]
MNLLRDTGPSGPELVSGFVERLRAYRGPSVAIMEVCGTHTVAAARMGLRGLLPEGVRLLSGPGCPVCVTPVDLFDQALHLVREAGVILATYGDAVRVPGTRGSLDRARSQGADVRVVYSALDALALAERNPDREVVLLGLGFETTAPTVAAALLRARQEGVRNFSVLSAHKAILPAMEALLQDPEVRIGAFLCPGHASMVLGAKAYEPLAERYGVPCCVAGFEPEDVLAGVLCLLGQVQRGEARVENAYPRAVSAEGNRAAQEALERVFQRAPARWRGLGEIDGSGYDLRPAFAPWDARRRFLQGVRFEGREPAGCRCAEVLRGRIEPAECPLFARACTPQQPVGACMVSSEGACGAHYRYRGRADG